MHVGKQLGAPGAACGQLGRDALGVATDPDGDLPPAQECSQRPRQDGWPAPHLRRMNGTTCDGRGGTDLYE
jgi:hypothetical protein